MKRTVDYIYILYQEDIEETFGAFEYLYLAIDFAKKMSQEGSDYGEEDFTEVEFEKDGTEGPFWVSTKPYRTKCSPVLHRRFYIEQVPFYVEDSQ